MAKQKKNHFTILFLGLASFFYFACNTNNSGKEKEDLDPEKTNLTLDNVLDSANQFIIDTDNDGIADLADPDIDGDGIPNTQDSDMDGDGIKNENDLDMDGDGYLNVVDADMDGDGILNSLDDDLDGDGIPNDVDPDMDGDGIANGADNDVDGDGIVNSADNTMGGENTIINGIVIKAGDLDGDGIDNRIDPDIDGDGISNKEDDDIDGDGYPNGVDFNFGIGKDPITNNDGNKDTSGTVTPDTPITDTTGGSSSTEDGSKERIRILGQDQCYFGDDGSGTEVPLVKIIHAVSDDLVDIVVIFSPDFVDNTWGENVVETSNYKSKNRPFRSVHKSDHVVLNLRDANQKIVMDVKLDLLSEINDSTWITLGPNGEDGYIGGPNNVGELKDILSFGTTTHDNLNEYGYDVIGNELHINSPATDSVYTPNPEFPKWEYKVAYRLTVTKDLFGTAGYGDVLMTSVHASPSKTPVSTIDVSEDTCEDTEDLFDLLDITEDSFEITEWTE